MVRNGHRFLVADQSDSGEMNRKMGAIRCDHGVLDALFGGLQVMEQSDQYT